MWTYNRAFKPLLPFSKRISLHAETEFFRSLNKNRLIAFIGSGVALPYGRLTWTELCALLIMDVDKRFWEELKQNEKVNQYNPIIKEVKSLHNTLRVIMGEEPISENEYKSIKEKKRKELPKDSLLLTPTLEKNVEPDTTMLELCSELATLLDYHNEKEQCEGSIFLKKCTAKYLTQGPIGQFQSRLKLVDGYGENSLYKKWKNVREEKEIEIEIEKEIPQLKESFLDELKALYSQENVVFNTQILQDEFEKQWLTEDKKSFKRQALEERPWTLLMEELKKPNYLLKNNPLKPLFEDLVLILRCASMQDAQISQGKWSNPIKTIVEKLNIKRYVTLNYDTEIERYFLLTKGYQAKKNDHLLSTNRENTTAEHIAVRRNGFGSQMTSVTLQKNMVGRLINFAAASKQNDSYIFHLHGRGDCAESLILTEKDYQELYVKSSKSRVAFAEGINTLFGGNDMLFLGVGMEETDLLQPLRQFVSESRNVSLRHDGILALLDKEINTKGVDVRGTEKKALKLHTEFGVKTMFYNPKISCYIKDYKNIKTKYKNGDTKEEDHQVQFLSDKLELMYISRKMVCYKSKSFNKKLIQLADDQQKWWREWKTPPGKRVAKFFDWSNESKNASKIWIRQKICLLPEDSEIVFKEGGGFNNQTFKNIANKIENIDPFEERRIILRYTGSTGVGKGTLLHALQVYCKNKAPDDKYIGCFFADAKFSTEYTSVISALSRFFAGLIADKVILNDLRNKPESSKYNNDKEKISFRKLAEEEKTFDKIWVRKNLKFCLPCGKTRILEKYLHIFKKRYKNDSEVSPRVLICLSGLDRLADKHGYAYNALHRDFFKVLTDPVNKDIPITLLLMSGNPETPIRYLSEPKEKNIPWDCQQAILKGWTLIPKIELSKRNWLPVRDGFDDGLACDIALGIQAKKQEPVKRTNLAQVAKDHLSVHCWLRILLNFLQKKDQSEQSDLLNSLELAASRNSVSGVIDRLLNIYEVLDTEPKKNRHLCAYQTILRHLALFSVPVERAVLANCPEVVNAILANDTYKTCSERNIARQIDNYLKTLNQIGLIIKIEKSGSINENNDGNKNASYRYTLVGIIRKHLAKRIDFDAYTHGEFSFFDVSLYPTQPLDLPSPKERDFLFVGKILQKIISNARYNLKYLKNKQSLGNNLDSIYSLSRTIRAAVNLINGSFSIGVVSRLENTSSRNIEYVCGHAQPFEAYSRWLRCLSNIAVAIEQFTVDRSHTQMPLYETEAAWIYNEQGLVNLIQGRLFDSLQLFRIAKERLECSPWVDPDDTESYPSLTSLRRVELNYAITMMESGMIKEAEDEFFRLYQRKEKNKRNDTSLTAHLACGYLGLCYHFQGRLTQAEERYKEVLAFSRKENKNFLRVTAIFRMHYGNLKRGLNDYKKAELYLNIAIEAAASAKQMDVFHHASVSMAKLLLSKAEKGYSAEAINLLSNATTYAKKMGLYKLQVHADIIRGEVLVAQKQYIVAGKLLAHAIAITNKHGMRIMKIRALQVYSKALIKRGTNKQITDDILNTAKLLSENTGYLIKWTTED